ANGASATVRLVVRATSVGTITNTIVVTADVADPSSANNRIQVVTSIAAPPSGPTTTAAPPSGITTVSTPPGGDTTAPTVVNLQRFGYHTDPVSLVVSYSEAVSMTTALELAHYSVRGRGKDGRFGTHDDRIIPLRSLRRGPGPNSVVLHISGRLYAYVPYLLTVDGQGPDAVADLAGNRLDGDHDGQIGGDYVRRFNRNIIAGKAVDLRAAYETPSRVRMRGSHPSARRLAIPVVPGHRGAGVEA